MKSFKEYYLVEAQTSAAMEMERVIVAAAGGPSYTPRDKKITPDAGKKIVKDLKLTGKGQMPKNAYDVTSDWASYFPKGVKGGTKTPKTDFLIGRKRISLKTGDGAQLMSGGPPEATATFYAACKTGAVPIEGAIKTLEGLAEIRHADTKARFTVVDGKELIFMVLDDAEVHPSYDVGIWVNTPFFASAVVNLFDLAWDTMKTAEQQIKS